MKECNGLILHKLLTKVFVTMVKDLVEQYFIHLKFDGVVFLFDNLSRDEYKGDSFVVVNRNYKKMSSKLLSCIQSQLDKLFNGFVTVWLDKDQMVHAVFQSQLFLSD